MMEAGNEQKLGLAFQLLENEQLLQAEQLYGECIKIGKEQTDLYRNALHGMGYVKCGMKKFEEARMIYEELRGLAVTESNLQEEHVAIHQLGMVERLNGNYEKALDLFEEELRLLEQHLPEFTVGFAANYYEQGQIALIQRNYVTAQKHLSVSLQASRKAEDHMCLGCAYRGLGELSIYQDEKGRAEKYFSKSIEAFEEAGDIIAVKEVIAMMGKI